MPDWFYRTVSRPMLFRLSAVRARDFALGFMGTLSRLPLGGRVIDFLGHMRADPRLSRECLGLSFASPLGIGAGLDARAVALPAFARFGIGFLQVGPVTLAGSAGASPLERRSDQQAIWRPEPAASLSLTDAIDRLQEMRGQSVKIVVHVASQTTNPEQARIEYEHLVTKLAPWADVLVLEGALICEERLNVACVLEAARRASPGVPVLVSLPVDLDVNKAKSFIDSAIRVGLAGVALDGSIACEPNGRIYGLPTFAMALEQLRRLRQKWPDLVILGAGGIHEPTQAVEMLQAGASLVSTDTGLIYTGPGLCKRINDAVLFTEARKAEATPELAATERVWFWTTLLATGMLFGSFLALIIASTRIVLPYDERFVGLSRAELHEINDRLLAFMAHDRVSLAGTMIALGVVYLGLSLGGIRRSQHWAQQALFISAFTGSASFFLFLGYGYLDPFHAFVTAILFQFLILALHCKLAPSPTPTLPAMNSDWRWRLSLWGQLILIGHGFAVTMAGLIIGAIGVTSVFVHEDLEFMRTSAEALAQANPYLVPLIAHDRATFGGNLVACGLVLFLSALWGFRPGSAWLWWTMLVAGVAAYTAAIVVHLVVGYTDLYHLTPAIGGLATMLLGLGLSYPFLCAKGTS